MPIYIVALGTFLLALLLSLGLGAILLPVLRCKKAGQPISRYAPESHSGKSGTPTMGGLSFVPAFLLAMAAAVIYWALKMPQARLIPVALIALYALFNAAIGFVDDYCKLLKKQNEGLTDAQKFILQAVAAAAFIAMMAITGHLSTAIRIPYLDVSINLGWLSYPLYLLVLVGFVNATNITDGLDGLASSITAVVAAFIIALAYVRGEAECMAMSAALLGCVVGFLFYNRYPAKMFMGDTGSLFLGSVIMGMATLSGELLLFCIAGLMFVIEMLSSLIQRLGFKLTRKLTGTGKRIFKMAPLHHHLEKCGWRERTVVLAFALLSLVFCALAYIGI